MKNNSRKAPGPCSRMPLSAAMTLRGIVRACAAQIPGIARIKPQMFRKYSRMGDF